MRNNDSRAHVYAVGPWIFLASLFMALAGFTGKPAGAAILVTTTEQKVSADGDCSLQEAIFAANFDVNQAISPVAPDLTSFIPTNFTAGSGDDTIELQAGAVYHLSSIMHDPLHQLRPT